MNAPISAHWGIVIFVVDGIENHCGLDLPDEGLADCSLAGVRLIGWDHRSIPKGDRVTFDIVVPKPESGRQFAQRPGMLMPQIIAQERNQRGWHLTPEAPFLVRTVRDRRSINPDDMNCVEWVLFALESAGVAVPDDVLTPRELLHWCSSNLGPPRR